MDGLRIIPRGAPFILRFLGAIVVIVVIAIAAWWYYGTQADRVEEIFREANSERMLPAHESPTQAPPGIPVSARRA